MDHINHREFEIHNAHIALDILYEIIWYHVSDKLSSSSTPIMNMFVSVVVVVVVCLFLLIPEQSMAIYITNLSKHELHLPTDSLFFYYDSQPHPTNNSHRQHFTTKYNIKDNILQGILDHYMSFHISEKCSPDTDEYQSIILVNETRMKNIFKFIYNDSFPVMKTKRKYGNCLSWLTVDLEESIRSKNKLHRISRKHPTSYNDTLYWEYR